MASYAATVHENLLCAPTVYGFDGLEELRVADHLFLTSGNGYKWEAGELVDKFPEESPRPYWGTYIRDVLYLYYAYQGVLVGEPKMTDSLQTLICVGELKQFSEEAALQRFLEEEREKGLSFAQVSPRYSRAFNVPDDVKPDWLDAMIGFLEIVVEARADIFSVQMESAAQQQETCREQLQKLKGFRKERSESTVRGAVWHHNLRCGNL